MVKSAVCVILFAVLGMQSSFSQINEKDMLKSTPGIEITDISILNIDTLLKVEYKLEKDNAKGLTPVFFVNGQLVNNMSFSLSFLRPDKIESMKITKDSLLIDGKLHSGRIDITMVEDYDLKLISLTELKSKYTNLGESKALYFVDDKFIEENSDNYLVNEPDLMRIYIEKCRNPEIADHIIRVLTNTEENVYNLRNPKIMIRGDRKIKE